MPGRGPGDDRLRVHLQRELPGAAVGLDSGTQEAHWTLARSINPGVPVFSSETYPGWLTHWGEKWQRPSVPELVKEVTWLLDHKKSFNFNMLKIKSIQEFISVVNQIKKERKSEMSIVDNAVEQFKTSGYAESWKNGEKSNQEFLLLLNKYSGRTFNSQTQYPFFPHVLVDYTSHLIDFHELKLLNKVYRDFKRTTICMFEEKEDFFGTEYVGDPFADDAEGESDD